MTGLEKSNAEEKHAPGIRHVFDGIEEEDNDLPRWWLNMFYATIVFGFLYMAWYHWPLGKGLSQEEEFEAQVAAFDERIAAKVALGFDYQPVLENHEMIASGATTYAEMCIPCHGDKGQGGVGPNLTDDFWVTTPTLAGVEGIIANGNPEKGMPAWAPVIGMDKVRQLVVFVRSLRGTSPDSAKEAEGNPGTLQ